MNTPSIVKIIQANLVKQGTVIAGCNMEGIVEKDNLRVLNNVDPNVISAKYLDRYTNEDMYGN